MLFGSCRKDKIDESELAFPWVQLGHSLSYSYDTPNVSIENALTINVGEFVSGEYQKLRFEYGYKNDIALSLPIVGTNFYVFRDECGLKTSRIIAGAFTLFPITKRHIRVPKIPVLNDEYPDYYNEDSYHVSYLVVEESIEITVPAGTFDTYVLYDSKNMIKEYWNEQKGLIKIELLGDDGIADSWYALSETNYL